MDEWGRVLVDQNFQYQKESNCFVYTFRPEYSIYVECHGITQQEDNDNKGRVYFEYSTGVIFFGSRVTDVCREKRRITKFKPSHFSMIVSDFVQASDPTDFVFCPYDLVCKAAVFGFVSCGWSCWRNHNHKYNFLKSLDEFHDFNGPKFDHSKTGRHIDYSVETYCDDDGKDISLIHVDDGGIGGGDNIRRTFPIFQLQECIEYVGSLFERPLE